MKITVNGIAFTGPNFVKFARLMGLKGTKVELLNALEIASKLGSFRGIVCEAEPTERNHL